MMGLGILEKVTPLKNMAILNIYVTRWWQLKYFLCSPLFGEDSHFDEHIFQMGWFNHQPG